jgi:hypothetical protein
MSPAPRFIHAARQFRGVSLCACLVPLSAVASPLGFKLILHLIFGKLRARIGNLLDEAIDLH